MFTYLVCRAYAMEDILDVRLTAWCRARYWKVVATYGLYCALAANIVVNNLQSITVVHKHEQTCYKQKIYNRKHVT